MDEQPAFGRKELFSFVLRDMAKAVSERKGETREQQFGRHQAAVHLIMGFRPRDVTELMLAGHCMMFHEVLTADVRASLCDETATKRRPLVALNKAFNDNLDRLESYRQRHAEAPGDAPEAPTPADAPAASAEPTASAEPEVKPAAPEMNRAARRQAVRAQKRAAAAAFRAVQRRAGPIRPAEPQCVSPQSAQKPDGTIVAPPLREAIAKCQANPEAMTALVAGDPARFARALGIDTPGEAFLAAAKTSGSPFDPQSNGPWPTGSATAIPKP
jgi:hypothetical protein